MAIDASIAMQGKLPQFDNPLAGYAQVAAIQNAQNQNQLAQYTISKAQRDDADALAQRNLLTGANGDLDAGYNALLKGGYLDRALAIKKAQQEQLKTGSEISKNNAEAGNKNQEVAAKRIEMIGQTMGALQGIQGVTPQHVSTALQHLVDVGAVPADQLPRLTAEIPQDPAALPGWLAAKGQAAMKVADQMKYTTVDANTAANNRTSLATNAATNATSLQTTGMNNATSRANNAATVGATVRGQDMKAAEGQFDPATGMLIDTTTGAAKQVVTPDGKPVGSGKPLTEFQGKSTGYAARAQEADKLIASLDGKYSPAAINSKASVEGTPLIGGALAAGVNKFSLSSQDRQAEQAQRDFINAILRQESGAAIGAGEFDSARKQYFTQPGDDPATIAQKATNRRLAIEGLKSSAGPGAARIDGMVTNSQAAPAKQVSEAVKNGEVAKLVNARPVKVSSAADYAKLPSGTVYTAPDGSMRTKQ